MKNRKNLKMPVSVVLILTILFGLAACGKSPENDPASKLNPDATLKVWFGMYPEENLELQAVADEFTAETGVKVEIIDNNYFEISTKYPIVADSPEGPDLLLVQNSDLGTLVESGSIRPTDTVGKEMAERYSPVAIEAFTYNQKQYGIGYSSEGYGIVYNKDIISEVPATWSEFFDAAEQLTQKDASGNITQYGFMIDPTNYWFVYPLVARYGGYYFGKGEDGGFNPDDLGVANDGSVKAYTELLALKESGLTTQTIEEDYSTVSQLFAEGKVGMMIYALWYAGTYQENGIDYGYTVLPANDDGSPNGPLGSVLGMVANAYSSYPAEADAFLAFMMKDENQQRLCEAANGGEAKNGQRSTLNNSVYQSEYFQSDENLKTLAEIGMTCQVFPSNPEATIIWSYATQTFQNIFYNGADVESSLKEMETAIKADIATLRGQ